MQIQRVLILAFVCISLLSSIVTAGEDSDMPLSSLSKDCRIFKRWVGIVQDLPSAAWLDCGCGPVIVTHPWNLIGKVNIETPEQALEYVRFFSTSYRSELFLLDGTTEIRPEDQRWGADILKTMGIEKSFRPPEAKELPPSSCNGKEPLVSQHGKDFWIRRVVMLCDQNVYLADESVTQDGYYSMFSKKLLVKDVTRFGIIHCYH